MRLWQTMHAISSRIRELIARRRLAEERDEEMQFHIDAETEHNVARGMPPAEARRAAMLAFGGVQRFREEAGAARGFARMDGLAREIRLAFRRLSRAPGFALGLVATLAIALGAATAIGAVIYGVMLRPLPYRDPERLVLISVRTPGLGMTSSEQSAGTFVYLVERARSYSVLAAAMENKGVAITDGESPERVAVALVTPSLFRALGTTPAAGRLFRDEDAVAGLESPVMISHEIWRRRFGATPDIAGKYIELNRRPRLIAGVLPAGFDYPSRAASIYYPEAVTAERAGLTSRYLTVVGRLAEGVTLEQAQAELNGLVAHFHERFTELSAQDVAAAGLSARVETLRSAIIAPVKPELTLLGIMVVALLLIAMANVATLSLLRAQRLRGEIAVSRALGASSGTLTQRFVVESVIVSLVGGLLALPAAAFALSTKFGLTDEQLPRLHAVSLTNELALLLLITSVTIGVLLGLVSAARAGAISDGQTAPMMRSGTRTTPGRGWRRAQETLVTLQIAFALCLLLATGLMASSLLELSRVDIGFEPKDAAAFSIALPFRPYPTYQRTVAFHHAVVDQLRAVPEISAVGVAMQFPSTPQLLYVRPQLRATLASGATRTTLVNANIVSSDFFQTMRIPLLAGRAFAPGDLASPTPGVVLSASLARELFGAEDPVGREVRIVSNTAYPPYRVVGVSGDVFGDRLTEGPLRAVYFPMLAELPPTSTETESRIPFMPAGVHFVVRSTLPLAALRPIFTRAVASVDSRVPLWDTRTLDAIAADATARTRLTMMLLGIAAVATLLLGAIGLYSVIAYAVAGRTREFAVRLAIGATPAEVTRQVLREGAVVAGVGLLTGIVLSLASTGVLRDLLFEVSATDPVIYAAAVVIVLLCTALATYAPARRAGHTNPAQALQAE